MEPVRVLIEVERGCVVSVRSSAPISVRVLDRDCQADETRDAAELEAWAEGFSEQLDG